jgi:hypothetical protein
MNTRTETIKAIKDGKLFDFLANHYWEMSKDELGTIAKELAYALSSLEENAGYSLPILDDAKESLINELEDSLHDEDDE